MKEKVGRYFTIAFVLLLFLGAGVFIGSSSKLRFRKGYTSMDKLNATLDLIEEYYVDSVSTEELVNNLIPELINQLDPHSTYLTREQKESEKESLEGHFSGIGVTFNTIKDTAIVVSVIPNGPSDIAGIKAGDRIVSADGEPLSGIPADSIRSLLRGAEGSIVDLGVRSYNKKEIEQVQVRRGTVNVRQVEGAFMVNDSLGSVRLSNFAFNTYNDFMQAVAKLRSEGAKGLVLDLRGNPGGLMQSALQIANEMLPPNSLIIYMEGLHYPRYEIHSDGTGTLVGFPVYVLVDGMSASSSEIVTGAAQDNDVAIIVGRRTFGKGLVQKPYEYYDGSSVNLTIAHYYTPSGRSIQREYSLGNSSEYSLDWMDRYNNGELFHEDSVHFDPELLYKTKGGRSVFGGGGIMPDVYVPTDTIGYNSYYMEVYSKGLLPQFAFHYADTYRDLLSRLGDPEKCYQFLLNQGLVWQFANYATKHGVRPRNYLVYLAQDRISEVLYPLVIEYIYGADAGWMIRSKTDPMFEVVSGFFADGIYSPHQIPKEELAIPDTLLQANTIRNDEEE
ncbi:MAG: S41 family peptidase [Porphyromonas sp.]|nr:S41 family peptidase [Porphyromonas sp.]